MKLLLAAAGAACLLTHASFATTPQPVVVELFTSQSCSSCPPADAFLAELKRTRPDLLLLDFHVDYWDSLSWKDPYSSAAATERQRRYAEVFEEGIYTPQMVVGGSRQAVGSDRAAVTASIEAAKTSRTPPVPLHLGWDGHNVAISIGPGRDSGTLWLVDFDEQHVTPVGRGENAGRTLTEVNVVRSLQALGRWHGAPVRLDLRTDLAPPTGQRGAVLLQADDGRILAAGELPTAR